MQNGEYLKVKETGIETYDALLHLSGGDARKLYNILELAAGEAVGDQEVVINDDYITALVQQHIALYDKGGEVHYDVASAFIKSIRGSDPNAAVYWLARMIEGGEDVKFIA